MFVGKVELSLEYAVKFVPGACRRGLLQFIRSSSNVHVVKGSSVVEVLRLQRSFLVNIERTSTLLVAALSSPDLLHGVAGARTRRLL